ncbi:MAG: hypothetical protein NTY90_03705 [Candidatus Micrarchaeota archaeon]|nr:hypothetical protein [Candidatus Micrarchaeota archaeon]
MDKRLGFQVLLLAGLAASAAASFVPRDYALAWLSAFSIASLVFASTFSGEERVPSFSLAALFIFLSCMLVFFNAFAGVFLSNAMNLFLFAAAVAVAVALVFWAFIFKKTVKAKVVGYSNGFAILEVKPSFAHSVKAGVYAVRSKPVKAGAVVKARVERRLFGSHGLEAIE